MVTLILVLGTWLIIMYARGYRINPTANNITITETGVLSVITRPTKAKLRLYQNDNITVEAKTPKTIGSVPTGNNKLEITKNEYRAWERDINITAGRSTTVYAQLFLKEIALIKTSKISYNQIIDITVNRENDELFILLKGEDDYVIYKYNANYSSFFNNQNLEKIYSFTADKDTTLSIYPSPNGSALILRKVTKSETQYILIKDNSNKELNLSDLSDEYSLIWANDNKFIILESDNEILALDSDSNTRYLIQKKHDDVIWDTDYEGNFYYLKENKNKDNLLDEVKHFTIYSFPIKANNKEKAILEIYTTNNDKYYQDLQNISDFNSIKFNNSPENRLIIGTPKQLVIDINGNGILFGTDKCAYWYDTYNKYYRIINTKPISDIHLAPDNTRLSFISNNNLYVFNFNNDNDQSIKLGSFLVKENIQPNSIIQWLSNSENISFIQDNSLHIITRYGDNDIILKDIQIPYYMFNNKINVLFVITDNHKTKEIIIEEYKIQ